MNQAIDFFSANQHSVLEWVQFLISSPLTAGALVFFVLMPIVGLVKLVQGVRKLFV